MTYPIGSLQRALADRAQALADGTHVDARDLGSRAQGHAPYVTETRPDGTTTGHYLPFLVVTAAFREAMGWQPHVDAAGRPVRWVDANELAPIEDAVFAGERAVRAANAADAESSAGLPYADGDDAADWDTDDGPANDGAWDDDPERLTDAEVEEIEARSDAEVKRARARALPPSSRGVTAYVDNPFTQERTGFRTPADAYAYARACSASDVLEGDLGIWSVSAPGSGHYRLFKGGRPFSEIDEDQERGAAAYADHLDANHCLDPHVLEAVARNQADTERLLAAPWTVMYWGPKGELRAINRAAPESSDPWVRDYNAARDRELTFLPEHASAPPAFPTQEAAEAYIREHYPQYQA